MSVEIETKTEIVITAYKKGTNFQTNEYELYSGSGDDITSLIDFDDIIQGIEVPDGAYKIRISIESCSNS